MKLELMPPAVRHYCKSINLNTGVWCEPDRDLPIERFYTYTYKCLNCGEKFFVKVELEKVKLEKI